MYPYIHIVGNFNIPTYGTLFLIGFIIAIFIGRHIGPSMGIGKDDAFYGMLYCAIGILIGSKVMYFVSKLPNVITNFSAVIKWAKTDFGGLMGYLFGGLVFYGGLIGAIIGIYRYCYHFRVSFKAFVNVYAPLIPLIHAFGRVGCFLAGCCYGMEYHGFGAVQFPSPDKFPMFDTDPVLSSVPRLPVQLIEAGLNIIAFIILWTLTKKRRNKPMQTMGFYLVYYTVARFVLEFFRGDIERGYFGAITTSQWISLLLLPIAVILIRGRWQEKHLNTQDRPLNRRELARREKYKAWYEAQEAKAAQKKLEQETEAVQEQDSADE
ncbi:MAG: prolipoprotein diacylglyceryl transferase [Lachnospiraceae bacterium]